MSEPAYEVEDLVLAKVSGYKPWPSIVCPEAKLPSNILAKKPKRKQGVVYPVYFLADGTFSWCSTQQLTRFDEKVLEDYEKNKHKLKGVIKKSYEIAITKPKVEDVVPVFVEPELEPEAEAEPEAEKKPASKKRKAAAASTAAANKKKAKPAAGAASAAKGKAKKASKPKPEPESESESETEKSEEEEETEVKQSFIPDDLNAKALADTVQKNTKNVEKLRSDLQQLLLLKIDSTELVDEEVANADMDQDKENKYIEHFTNNPQNMTKAVSVLNKTYELAQDRRNFVLFKKHKLFKILQLLSQKPELEQIPKLQDLIKKTLTLYDDDHHLLSNSGEKKESTWSSQFDLAKEEAAKKEAAKKAKQDALITKQE